MTWPLICVIYNFLHPGMICTKFDWNWPAGCGDEFLFFLIYKHILYTVFPIVAPLDPEDHDLNKLESTLYQKAFM
jgi:hypothetical protein